MARLGRLSVVGLVAVSALALSACGTGAAVTDARTSCGFVKSALIIEAHSLALHLTTAQRNFLRGEAMGELLKGSAPAAQATSADGSWNALQTTIQEAERVPLSDLIPALTRICQVADSATPYL